MGALSKLDEFLLYPQVRSLSGTDPRTSRNANVENQESTGDRFQNDPHPEVEVCVCQSRNLYESDPDEPSPNLDLKKDFDTTTDHRTSRHQRTLFEYPCRFFFENVGNTFW